MKTHTLIATAFITVLFLSGCSNTNDNQAPPPTTLKDAFKDHFLIGATVNNGMLLSSKHPSMLLAQHQFNALTTDNDLKWERMNPRPNEYDFESIDAFVEKNNSAEQHLVGHVLFWHSQTPDWVFEDENGAPLSREALLKRMKERAQLLADRYGDKIKIWDVVNEAITDEGQLRNSKYHQIIGDDFIEQAFRIAEEAFPADCQLLYNDYGMTRAPRKKTVIAMVNDLRSKNVKIDGIGMQGHWSMATPSTADIEQAIIDFSGTLLPIHITELDIDYLGRDQYFGANVDIEKLSANVDNNPYPDGNFPEDADRRLIQRYQDVFSVLLKHSSAIERVTFWGVTDADSWLNDWPIQGRTNYPLLFNRDGKAKSGFSALLKQGREAPKKTLKSAFEGKFLIGGALNNEIINAPNNPAHDIVKAHFNSITSTNALKWDHLNPEPGVYTPELADKFVEYGIKNDLDIVGHPLFWYQQTPDWVFEDDQGRPASRELLLKRMRERARYIADRYGDKIKTWDVVNEALDQYGMLRKSKFSEIIGPDYIEQAFLIATEELPKNTKLIYNEFGMAISPKSIRAILLTKSIRSLGGRIDGIGIQGHWELDHPSVWRARLALASFKLANIPVYITEFDVDLLGRRWYFNVNQVERDRISLLPETDPYTENIPPPEVQEQLSAHYRDIFSLYLDYADTIERVTFWGVTDNDSWLNDFPVKGRTNYPLLFDRLNKPKRAFFEVLNLAEEKH